MTMEAIEVMHKGEKLSDLLSSGVPEEEVSPMMQHYLLMKKNYPDCILFYRLGDFYEMFFAGWNRGRRCVEFPFMRRRAI